MRDAVQQFTTFNGEFAKRSPELMKFKIARMAENPFAFFRGSFHLFARDVLDHDMIPLPLLNSDGVEMDLVGDIHSENYGTYKAEDGQVHYDINDFDETAQGRFDFDVCRFAVNMVLASQERKDTLENQTAAVMAGLASYLETVQASLKKAKFIDLDFSEKHPGDCNAVAQLLQTQATVKRSKFIADLTDDKDGKRQIKRSLLKYFNLNADEKAQAERLLDDFRKRFTKPVEKNFFDFHDACGRISGIGSMGRYRYVVLVNGKSHEEKRNVLLEFKEARPSGIDLGRNRETSLLERAEKVIACQRASQAAASPYLGIAIDGAMSFQVREISPHAARVDLAGLKFPEFVEVLKTQAAILARVHVRSASRYQGPSHPLPELADAERFRQRVLAFALGDADVAFRDWSRFVAAKPELENVSGWAN